MQYITAIRLSEQITHLKLKISKVNNSIIKTYIIKLIEKNPYDFVSIKNHFGESEYLGLGTPFHTSL